MGYLDRASWHGQRAPAAQSRLRAERAALPGRELASRPANFGCGSSREHAPWALGDYGFRALIAPSYADIFLYSFKNGLLPIVLNEFEVSRLFDAVKAFPGFKLVVDLERQLVATPDDSMAFHFEVDPFRKHCLLNGLDDIGLTLQHADAIREFEERHLAEKPWSHRFTRQPMKIAVLPGDGIGRRSSARPSGCSRCFDAKLVARVERAAIGAPVTKSPNIRCPKPRLRSRSSPTRSSWGRSAGRSGTRCRARCAGAGHSGIRSARPVRESTSRVLYPELAASSTLKPEVSQASTSDPARAHGDIYFGEPRGRRKNDAGEDGASTRCATARARSAASPASASRRRVPRQEALLVDKANVLDTIILLARGRHGNGKDYPDVELSHMYVDNAAMQLVRIRGSST